MRALLLACLCFVTAGCAGLEMKPGSKSMARREIPPGPGLLTGSQGEFVIFRVEGATAGEAPAPEPGVPAKEGEVAK